MTALTIRHLTTYRYRQSVRLWPHRLMLRPRESRGVHLLGSELVITPQASVSWTRDVFDNAIATASFPDATDALTIDSLVKVELDALAWPVFAVAAEASAYPFRYPDDEWTDLGALTIQQYPDPNAQLRNWARGFIYSTPTDTLALLKDLNSGISARIRYQVRDDEGTQSPVETLQHGSGSCRDFAVLFAEAARCLGFGARIVSGYLYIPDSDMGSMVGSSGAGATHAWAEVFVPGAGWIAFDPTNRLVGGLNLIPVAVARDIGQAMPVTGSFVGTKDDLLGMSVAVTITA